MVQLQIYATIAHNKLLEFNQSKMTFINALQKVEGYRNFIEKQGEKFEIMIVWNSQSSLNQFLKSDLYKIFRGSLITLSNSFKSNILN